MTTSKYNTGKIYSIVNIFTDEMYIGSSYNDLEYRFNQHISQYKCWKKFQEVHKWRGNGGIGYSSAFYLFDKYGIDNCRIELIEDFACETKQELELQEGEYHHDNHYTLVNMVLNKSKKHKSRRQNMNPFTLTEKRSYVRTAPVDVTALHSKLENARNAKMLKRELNNPSQPKIKRVYIVKNPMSKEALHRKLQNARIAKQTKKDLLNCPVD